MRAASSGTEPSPHVPDCAFDVNPGNPAFSINFFAGQPTDLAAAPRTARRQAHHTTQVRKLKGPLARALSTGMRTAGIRGEARRPAGLSPPKDRQPSPLRGRQDVARPPGRRKRARKGNPPLKRRGRCPRTPWSTSRTPLTGVGGESITSPSGAGTPTEVHSAGPPRAGGYLQHDCRRDTDVLEGFGRAAMQAGRMARHVKETHS